VLAPSVWSGQVYTRVPVGPEYSLTLETINSDPPFAVHDIFMSVFGHGFFWGSFVGLGPVNKSGIPFLSASYRPVGPEMIEYVAEPEQSAVDMGAL
jgi:hypothetical protein